MIMLEFRRIFKSKAMFIIWLVFVISLFALNFFYIFKATDSIRNEKMDVIKYDNLVELKEIINSYEERIEENNFFNENERTTTLETLSMYQYLYDNEIEYDEFRTYNELDAFENDKISYLKFVISGFTIVFLIIIMFLCVDVFNGDFLNGTYKYVYTRNIKREKIILKKLLISFLIVVSLLMISFLILKIIVSRFSLNYDYIILKGIDTICIDVKKAINKIYMFYVFDCLLYFIIFTSISLFSKNYIRNLIVCLLIVFMLNIVIKYIDIKFINISVLSGTNMLFDRYSNNEIIIGYLIRYVIAFIMLISSFLIFRKKSL